MFVTAAQARTLDTSGLLSIQLGAAWVYANSWTSVWRHVEHAEQLLAEILKENICFQFGYLYVRARKEDVLREYDKPLVRFLANDMAARGLARKLLSRTADGYGYAVYFDPNQAGRINDLLLEALAELELGRTVRFKVAAKKWFGAKKGAYYWAKGLLEHLVMLQLAAHGDEWSLRPIAQKA